MTRDLIGAFLEHLRMLGRSTRTITTYEEILLRLDEELPTPLDRTCEEELKVWIFRPEWSQSTKNQRLAIARSFFGWAVAKDLLFLDPTLNLPSPMVPRGLPRPPTDAQVRRILASPDPYWLWFRLAAFQGMRCCEIVALDRRDITELDTFVHGKGSKSRYVPTDPQVWRKVEGLPAGLLVTQLTGAPADAHYLSLTAARYFDRTLHMPDVTIHRLRHWYGTRTLEACDNLRTVQELLGHSSPQSTAVYTQVAMAQKRAAVAGLPDLD
jgi:integrase/recombinase XerC